MNDVIRLELHTPEPLPDMSCLLVKSGERRRWCVLIAWFKAERFDSAYWYDYVWWLQLRCWWPPVFFYRGWLKRAKTGGKE